MNARDVIVCDPKPMRFWQRFYLIEVGKGLAVTLRHFLGNLFARKYTVTVEWPEVKREYDALAPEFEALAKKLRAQRRAAAKAPNPRRILQPDPSPPPQR